MRALLISLLAVSLAAPVLAQEAPVATAPVQNPAPQTPTPAATPSAAPPVVTAPPATQDAAAPSATEAVDPLADLIAQSGPQTTDEEEATPQAPAPPHKPTILPIPAPDPDEADPNHAIPQGAYVPVAEAYDLRVKGSILAAQGLQGPLDGGWAIEGPDGASLYALQLVDKVGGYDGLEGAWRDTRRAGAVGSTGLIDFVERSYGGFQARFSPRPGQLAALDLTARGDGTWTGKLDENGVQTLVTARRVAQATLPEGYVPAGRGPVIWGAPRVAARPAPAPERAPACSTKGKKGKALKAAKAKCAAAAKKSGKGGATAKGKKAGKGKAVTAKKGAKGKATAKGSTKKKKR